MTDVSPRSFFRPILYLCAALWPFGVSLLVPSLGPGPLSAGTIPYFGLVFLHGFYGLFLFLRFFRNPSGIRAASFVPEFLFAYTLILFLFAYIFASNANLDYVQWFIRSGGNLRLAMDTRTERLIAAGRYAPFLLLNLGYSLADRTFRSGDRSLMLVSVSALLTALAFPSFAVREGLGVLAWICLVPLFMVLSDAPAGRGIFYGTLYGTLASTLINYWLGTFSLVSLQIIILIQLLRYLLFMVLLVPALKTLPREFRFLFLPCGWTVFEYVRSVGFLGYPWGLFGASQYAFLPVLQIASLTGVWGVSFLVVLVNAAAAEVLSSKGPRRFRPGAVAAGFLALSLLFGAGELFFHPPAEEEDSSLKVALIQQNSDPRKHDYRETFDSLRRLSDAAGSHRPDLTVWSETAFVPNIGRWSREDPAGSELAALVRDFLAYQKSLQTWLVTGNDDYEVIPGESGREERLNYNAAVLFSDLGERIATYHKMKLVPFTEYFPYREQLPRVYETLLAFDVHFWEPGREEVVFRHPKFTFSTPICFEDVFPDLVRRFVLRGADVMVNLSNDYWSLTETEAYQHASHALLRAVENRRPLLRSTASGLTLQADEFGRILKKLPCYEEGYLLASLPLRERPLTLYTRWGDWFPLFSAAVCGLLLCLTALRRAGKRSRPAEP